MNTRYVTGIGSRKTPEVVLGLMRRLATCMANEGWVWRSGHAPGADLAFEEGVLASQQPDNLEIYLPWANFGEDERRASAHCYYDVKTFANRDDAEAIAESVHPAWQNCSRGARMLHTRNPYQVLGQDLNTPSAIVFCYATPVAGERVAGGTATAVAVARQHRINVVNFFHLAARDVAERFIAQHPPPPNSMS